MDKKYNKYIFIYTSNIQCTKAECDKIHDTAVKVAQGFCDQVY